MTDTIRNSVTQPIGSTPKVPQRQAPRAERTASGTGKLTADSNSAPKLASSILEKNLEAVKKGANAFGQAQQVAEGLEEVSENSIDAAVKVIQGSLGAASDVAGSIDAIRGGDPKSKQRSETIAAAKGRVDSAVGAFKGGQQVAEGIQQLSEGDLGGLVDLGEGAVNLVKGAAETVVNAGDVARGLTDDSNRLVKLADRVGDHLQDGARVSQALTVGGALFGGIGGGAAVLKGIETFKGGERLAGAGQVLSGVSNVAESAAGLTAALATKGSLVAKVGSGLGGRVVPVLGVAGGVVQVGAALAKTPPDTKAAATGAMSTVGSVLMPFPPVGTVVGGALVAGAAVIDNWDAISGAAAKASSFVKGLFS